MSWEIGLALVASALAATSVGISVMSAIQRKLSLQDEIDTIRKADTRAAIESADLETLGRHVVQRLGNASLSNFSRSSELQSDFVDAFGAIRRYLEPQAGAPDSSAADTPTMTSVPPTNVHNDRAAYIDGRDDEWNGLARARRDLELALLARLGDADPRQTPLGKLLETARKERMVGLGDAEANSLQDALRIAGRSIHGDDVDANQATWAIGVLAEFTNRLRGTGNGASDSETAKRKNSHDRYVVQRDGAWVVVEPNSSRAATRHKTQAEAIDRARDLVYKAGGGEVIIHGRDGTIRGRDTVAKDPKVSRD